MTEPFKYAASLSWGGDEPTAEMEVEVTFTVAWGSPEVGQAGPVEGYDPGSPDLVEEICIVKLNGKAAPNFGPNDGFMTLAEFTQIIVDKLEDEHEEAMLEAAREEMERRAPD